MAVHFANARSAMHLVQRRLFPPAAALSMQCAATRSGTSFFSSVNVRPREDDHGVRLYLGTMTIGWNQSSEPVDEPVAREMLERFTAAGGVHVDSARIYSEGNCEPILGRALKQVPASPKFLIGSKAHPSQPGGLSAKGMRAQLSASMAALGIDAFAEYYLHQPDTEHDLSESLECVHELVQEGKIGALGLSNFSAVEVDRCLKLCEDNGWTKPTVCQVLYNPLNRMAEADLLPILRRHGISFIAYNPLAAGLLSGKHRPGSEVLAGRFKDNPNYLPRFYTPECLAAMSTLGKACDDHSIGLLEATYSWLLFNSKMEPGDGLLLGASSTKQLEQNLAACTNAKELPEPVRQAFDGVWTGLSASAFPYWRSYSADFPGRESLPQGAGYVAHGPK